MRALAEAIDAAGKVTIFAGAGVRGARDRGARARRRLARARRAQPARQGGHPGRQPVRRRHVRPARLRRVPVDAMQDADLLLLLGTDFPYDQFLPSGVRTAQVDIEPDPARPADPQRPRGASATSARPSRRCCPLVKPKKSHRFLDQMLKKHERAMSGVVGAYTKDVEHTDADPPRVRRGAARRGGGRRRRVHRRHGHVQRVGRPVHHAQRPAPRHRVVPARVDGERRPARHRGRRCPADGRHVVAMAGDGGLSMLLGELIT